MTVGLMNAVLGIWLIVSAFFWVHTPAQFGVAWVCGVVASLVGLTALDRTWGRYVNALFGLILLTASFNLRPVAAATLWNHALCGFSMLAMAIMAAARPVRWRP
jgi:hypothetical protein